MTLFCKHPQTSYFPAGTVLELPKSHHEQGKLHMVKKGFSVCDDCGVIVNVKPYAVFRFWQEQENGYPPFPLYDVMGDHPLNKSSVCASTLQKNGISVPETPTLEDWKSTKAA